jgi:hypothetical protein
MEQEVPGRRFLDVPGELDREHPLSFPRHRDIVAPPLSMGGTL